MPRIYIQKHEPEQNVTSFGILPPPPPGDGGRLLGKPKCTGAPRGRRVQKLVDELIQQQPEYMVLLRALRANAPIEQLVDLADEACVSHDRLRQLIELRETAIRSRPAAKQWRRVRRQWEALEAEIKQAKKRHAEALAKPTASDEAERLECEVVRLLQEQQRLQESYHKHRIAAEQVRRAAAEKVI